MRKRNYKTGKFNWRAGMNKAIAKKQRLAERLAEIDAYFSSEESRASLPDEVRERIEVDVEFYGKKEEK